MADLFRRMMDVRIGGGGVKCSCCNDYHGKERKLLNRMVRRTLKQTIRKDIDNE